MQATTRYGGPRVRGLLAGSRALQRVLLLGFGVLAILLVPAAIAWADAPNPTTITGTVTANADGTNTLSVQGNWDWSGKRECGDRIVGWEVDWNDPSQPGNTVATVNGVSVDVGAATANARNAADNRVDLPGNLDGKADTATCQNDGNGGSFGTWGPISHTYASTVDEVAVCAVIYDVKQEDIGKTGGHSDVAGGSGRNTDNSVEKNFQTNQCTTTTFELEPPPECSDGVDNADPEDNLADQADPGCHTDGDPDDGDNTYDPDDDDETDEPECSDGRDNDGDGEIDFPNDPDCDDPDDDDESPECSDGIDNDGDGDIDFPDDVDCDDPDDDDESPECSDGIDNDGDGRIDFPNDPDCDDPDDDDESPECSDGIDNDGDGEIDFPNDPDCDDPQDDDESPECSDGIDNDGDGLVDAADPGCHTDGDPDDGDDTYDPDDDDETDDVPIAQCGSAPTADSSRLAGITRVETAVEVSRQTYSDELDCEASAVVLTRSDLFPDAQAGAPLAVFRDAPLLLTQPDTLHPATRDEMLRVLPAGRTVYLLGGTAAISTNVENQVQALGYNTVRYGGANRFGTAAIIAEQGLRNPGSLFIADGGEFADSVVAGAAAASVKGFGGAAVILTSDSDLPPETAAYLNSRSSAIELVAVGTEAAAAVDNESSAIAGADDFGTSVAVSQTYWPQGPNVIGIATAADFADALAGGAAMGRPGWEGPILLTHTATLPDVVQQYLASHRGDIDQVVIFGGTAAVSDQVRDQINSVLGLE